MRRVCESTLLMMCIDPSGDDARVAQCQPAIYRMQRIEQWCVAAPVASQIELGVRDGRGCEIGVNIGPAERVNGLLGISDENEGSVTVERRSQNVPLHRIGVLEFIHQYVAVAVP